MAEAPDEAVYAYRRGATSAKLPEIALFFLIIGIIGFGGPLVHIAMMEDELVGEESREWTDESVFMGGLTTCNMLPGPASTQLGIFTGWVYAGVLSALVATVIINPNPVLEFIVAGVLAVVIYRFHRVSDAQLLVPHGFESAGMTSSERWQSISKKAGTQEEFIGVDPQKHPVDLS